METTMETSFSKQSVFDKVENWMANETEEVTTPLSSYSDVGIAAGYEVHFSPDDQRLFSDGFDDKKCIDCTKCSFVSACCDGLCHRIVSVFRRIFPYGYKTEFKGLLHIAWPITLTSILQSLLRFISLIFCGRLGKESINGVALATTIINVTGTSVMAGITSAFDTLLSQTFGSSNKQRMGLIIQRGTLIMGLACLPIFAIFINTEHILLLIGQHPEVSRLGGQYATISAVGFVGNVFNMVFQKYLQTQSIVLPGLIILVITNVFNAAFHALFIFGFNLGVVGAAIAVSITYWVEMVLHLLYIVVSGIYKDTWTGFSKDCLIDWKPFVHLALPGMMMICLEWWCFEILTFICGLVGQVPLAAHAIIYSIAVLSFMIPLGIAVAVGIRVGNQLGAGNPEEALTTSRVSVTMAWCAAVINCIVLLGLKDFIPRAFTDDLTVASLASNLIPQLVLFSFFDYTQGVLCGVLRGVGHQKFGALTNLVAYYMIALPIGIPLTLLTNLQVSGAWWSMLISVGFQSIAFLTRVALCNWEDESEKAQIRAGVKKEGTPKQSSSRGQSIPSIVFDPDAVSTDTQLEQMEADHLTLSDISSYKSDVCETSVYTYGSVFLSRVVVLVFFLAILIGGIFLRFYLNDKVADNNVNCLLINGTNLNMTAIGREIGCRSLFM